MFTYTNLISTLWHLPILLPLASLTTPGGSRRPYSLSLFGPLGFCRRCLPRLVHRAGLLRRCRRDLARWRRPNAIPHTRDRLEVNLYYYPHPAAHSVTCLWSSSEKLVAEPYYSLKKLWLARVSLEFAS
jgi:hypothetical protein